MADRTVPPDAQMPPKQLSLPGLAPSTIKKKKAPVRLPDRICMLPDCRKRYTPKKWWSKYCCAHHRYLAWVLRFQMVGSRYPAPGSEAR